MEPRQPSCLASPRVAWGCGVVTELSNCAVPTSYFTTLALVDISGLQALLVTKRVWTFQCRGPAVWLEEEHLSSVQGCWHCKTPQTLKTHFLNILLSSAVYLLGTRGISVGGVPRSGLAGCKLCMCSALKGFPKTFHIPTLSITPYQELHFFFFWPFPQC
jgi:hypothetical protein